MEAKNLILMGLSGSNGERSNPLAALDNVVKLINKKFVSMEDKFMNTV